MADPIDRLTALREWNYSKGCITINTNFDDNMMETVYFDLQRLIDNGNIKEITIYIHSNGGQVDALMPIIDLMDKCQKPIKTVALGKAYSCGAMLLLSGHKGKRFAHRHTFIVIHEVAGGTYGKNSQVQLHADMVKRTNETLKKIVAKRTKMTEKQISRYFDSALDIWITAEQALTYGIIDEIL